MALKKEAIEKIAKLTKLKVEDLEAAIKDEKEVDVAIDEKLETFTDTELTSLKNNEYKNGKEKGVEMVVKETKEKLNLEFQGKTIDGLITAAQKKALEEAKIEPDKKVQELNEKVATLQNTVQTYEKQISEKDKEVATVKINGELMKAVPAGTTLDPEDILVLMRSKGYEFEMNEGKLVAKKDGKELVDKVTNPLPVKDVVSAFVTERKLMAEGGGDPPGGRGGGGGGGKAVKYGKMSELKAQFETDKKSLLGEEFANAVAAAAKENPDFDMNS